MKTLLNVVWLLFSGIWLALAYCVAGIFFCILIITIPFGLASFRIAGFALAPFGNTIVRRHDAGAASAIGNVLWILFAGLWMAIVHIGLGVFWCCTIVGIPLGLANFKMVPVSLTPLGHDIVPLRPQFPPQAYANAYYR